MCTADDDTRRAARDGAGGTACGYIRGMACDDTGGTARDDSGWQHRMTGGSARDDSSVSGRLAAHVSGRCGCPGRADMAGRLRRLGSGEGTAGPRRGGSGGLGPERPAELGCLEPGWPSRAGWSRAGWSWAGRSPPGSPHPLRANSGGVAALCLNAEQKRFSV